VQQHYDEALGAARSYLLVPRSHTGVVMPGIDATNAVDTRVYAFDA